MKVCNRCGVEISGKDGENFCPACDKVGPRAAIVAKHMRDGKEAREKALRSLGLIKVRGALGGTYWK